MCPFQQSLLQSCISLQMHLDQKETDYFHFLSVCHSFSVCLAFPSRSHSSHAICLVFSPMLLFSSLSSSTCLSVSCCVMLLSNHCPPFNFFTICSTPAIPLHTSHPLLLLITPPTSPSLSSFCNIF